MSEEEKRELEAKKAEEERRKAITESLEEGLAQIFFRRTAKDGVSDVDDKFDVQVPKKNKIVLVLMFAVLIIAQYLIQYAVWLQESSTSAEAWSYVEFWPPLVFLACTIGPILLWGKVGTKIAQTDILKWLRKIPKKKMSSPIEFFLGFPYTNSPYFIEANPVDFDIKNTKMFLKRVLDAMFLSIGLSVFLTKIIYAIPAIENYQMVTWGYSNVVQAQIFSAIYMGPLSLVILFLIFPLTWIAEDMQIYRIDEIKDAHRIGTYVKSGLLSKILGAFGVVMAFDISKDFAELTLGGQGLETYLLTFLYFGMIFISLGSYPFLATLVYLLVYHKEWVNTTRIKASEFLPCGSIQVNYVKQKELEYLTHIERVKEFDKPDIFDKVIGKLLIILLVAISSGVVFWLAFLY